MNAKAQQILEEIRQLPQQARSELLALLREEENLEFGDQETQDAWIAELKRRDDDAESGRTPDIPFEQVVAQLRRDFPRT